ncbi:MAG: hypothetical protein R3C49_15480 [Planctomycetaceae bacterium]
MLLPVAGFAGMFFVLEIGSLITIAQAQQPVVPESLVQPLSSGRLPHSPDIQAPAPRTRAATLGHSFQLSEPSEALPAEGHVLSRQLTLRPPTPLDDDANQTAASLNPRAQYPEPAYPMGVLPQTAFAGEQPGDRGTPGTQVHVFPSGVRARPQPLNSPAPTVTVSRPAQQSMDVAPDFVPGDSHLPEIPSPAGIGAENPAPNGFSMEPTTGLPLLPEVPTVPDVFENEVSAASEQSDSELFWWEGDLGRSILRGRPALQMTLNQAMETALSEAPELQVLHSDWFIRQVEVTRQDAAFDWTTFANTIWNRDNTPVGSTLDGATRLLRNRTLNAAAGVRRLGRDGSQFEISQNMGIRSSNSRFINPNHQGNARLALKYEKPLLRGAGEDYNQGKLRLAEIEKDTAFDAFQIGVQDYLLEVGGAYWNLVLQRGRFLQAVTAWNRATEIAEEMSRRTEIDVTPLMMDRARSEVANRLGAARNAEFDLQLTQNSLLRLIYGARFTDFVDHEVVTLTLPMRDCEEAAEADQIQSALYHRSEIHRAIREIKSATLRYDLASNEVLPMLDMVFTSYVAGLRGHRDSGGAFANQFTRGTPSFGLGFEFEIPYRNRAAQAAAEQNFIAIKRMQAELQQVIAEVTEDVRNQLIERNKYASVLDQQWETLARTRRLLKGSQLRREMLADGDSVADLYLENLLMMQGRLQSAENAYLTTQVQLSLADNALMRAKSQLDSLAKCSESAAPVMEEMQPMLEQSIGIVPDEPTSTVPLSVPVREFGHSFSE